MLNQGTDSSLRTFADHKGFNLDLYVEIYFNVTYF